MARDGSCLHGNLGRACSVCDLLEELALVRDQLATVTAERDHFDEMLDQANDCDIRAHEELRALDAKLATVTAERDASLNTVKLLDECATRIGRALGFSAGEADSHRMVDAIRKLRAERDAARAEVAKLRHTTSALLGEFDRAVAHRDWINAGRHGMSVPFHGDFTGAIQHPGLMGRIRWWARQLRAALDATALREETTCR